MQTFNETSFEGVELENSQIASPSVDFSILKSKMHKIIKAELDPKNIFCVRNLQNDEKIVAKL